MIDFMRKIDNLSFVEAVERLADRVGIQLRYTDDAAARDPSPVHECAWRRRSGWRRSSSPSSWAALTPSRPGSS